MKKILQVLTAIIPFMTVGSNASLLKQQNIYQPNLSAKVNEQMNNADLNNAKGRTINKPKIDTKFKFSKDGNQILFQTKNKGIYIGSSEDRVFSWYSKDGENFTKVKGIPDRWSWCPSRYNVGVNPPCFESKMERFMNPFQFIVVTKDFI